MFGSIGMGKLMINHQNRGVPSFRHAQHLGILGMLGIQTHLPPPSHWNWPAMGAEAVGHRLRKILNSEELRNRWFWMSFWAHWNDSWYRYMGRFKSLVSLFPQITIQNHLKSLKSSKSSRNHHPKIIGFMSIPPHQCPMDQWINARAPLHGWPPP